MMLQSESIANLAAALAAAQGEFEAVDKKMVNPFFHSKYAGLPDVVLAASPILAKHGIAVTQLPDFDGENDLLTTLIMHSSGEWVKAQARLHLIKEDPQAQGSALTYMRRYAYSGGVGVVADEDDDGEKAVRRALAQPAAPKAAPIPQYEEVNGEQIPLVPEVATTRTGPGGQDASVIGESAGSKRLYAMVKRLDAEAYPPEVISEIIGREIKRTGEVTQAEYNHAFAELKNRGA